MPKKPEQLKREAVEAVSELLQVAVEQGQADSGERQPGMTIRRAGGIAAKVPWTRADVEKRFPKVTFMPEETIPVTWNGVSYQLREGEEITVPSVIKTTYDNHRKRVRAIGRGLAAAGVTKTQYSGEL